MFWKAFSFGGLLLLAGAAVLMTPGSSQAQHHGGGGHGGGGFHSGGGGHGGGGFHSGGGGFHSGGINHGSFNHGSFNHGGNHFGYPHHGYRGYHGYHYPRYHGYYGAWPYYYGYYPYYGYSGYYPYYNDTYLYGGGDYDYADDTPLLGDGVPSDSGYSGLSAQESQRYAPSTTAGTTVMAQPDNKAHVTVSVPAEAEIWFEGTKTSSPGPIRQFQSPPLTPGQRYTYEIRARWNENGHVVTQTQQVEVAAGIRVNVNFPMQPAKAPSASSR